MEVVEADGLAPLAQLLARHVTGLDMRLPELATAEAELLHAGNRRLERAIAEAVALHAEGHRVAALHGQEPDGRRREELPPVQRRADGGT